MLPCVSHLSQEIYLEEDFKVFFVNMWRLLRVREPHFTTADHE